MSSHERLTDHLETRIDLVRALAPIELLAHSSFPVSDIPEKMNETLFTHNY